METPLTPLDFGARARQLYAQREAVVDGDMRFTYQQFFDRCDRWSTALQKLGVDEGDKVALIGPNSHGMLEQFYAVPQIGAVIVPINYRLTADDFRYMIKHSGAKVVCAHSDYLAMVSSVRDELTHVDHFIALEGVRDGWQSYEQLLEDASQPFDPATIDERQLLSINYTSGTTSQPKGVMLTHRNVWANAIGTMAHIHLTQADRYLWTLPMFHVNGWTFPWIITAVGGTHICLRKVDAPTVYERIINERVTILCAAPTVLITIAHGPEEQRKQLPQGIRVLTAGAPPAAATIESVEGDLGWEITQVYGSTESAPLISICEPTPEHAKLSKADQAVIKARQGVRLIASGDLQVVDENDQPVPNDGKTLGEIVARGNVVMLGYYNDEAATAAALRGGWYHTGDAAVVHPDGYIEIRDRFKDVIISGGENISSIEVEGALLRHPAVLEVAVVGMAHERWGEAPHAFVVLKPGAHTTEEELNQFCRAHLAHFKVPKKFDFLDELPKTSTGKLQKFILRQNKSGIHRQ